ncbi:MAG: cation:proton antiporter [Deltaproteobacteria bacterium]|nr:cation:proton antiporter [Deltaproteobacteria bacterium]
MISLLLLLAVAGLMQAARTFSLEVGSGGTELAFGFLLLAAYFTGRVVSQFRLPKLTGWLLAGVLAGPFVLDLVTREMAGSLRVVNGVATCILGLVAGSELNLKRVRPVARTLRWVTVIALIGSMVVLAGVLFLIRPMLPLFADMTTTQSVAVCLLIGVAVSPQSPAVVMALLAETKADGPLSQFMLAAAVVSDLVAVLCYSIAAAVAGVVIGGGVDVLGTALSVGWELLGSVAFGAVIGGVIGGFLRTVKQGASMFALMICIVVAEIGTIIHLDPLVVMLAAGIWLENFSRADASDLLHGFESAQLPVFIVWFALAGTRLDLVQLSQTIVPVLILAAVRAGWYYAGTTVACRYTGASPVVARFAWIGLVPQAGLSLALIVVIQKTFPTFGTEAAVILLSVLAVNQIASPIALRIALIRSGEAGKKQGGDFAAGEH